VPISFGISSICLLHILDQQLQGRREQGRHAGYSLHVLFVDQSAVLGQAFPRESRDLLMKRYSLHAYTTILLEDYANYETGAEVSESDTSKQLKDILYSLSSATSRTDFIDITRRRLITSFAERHRCDSILFGDSTTRLAERTLSETAKGRGIALPWLTADGHSSGLNCTYPLRDLLRKELMSYANIASPPLTSLISEPPPQVFGTSLRDSTIDGLMNQYFESVEKDYPSIVANVVRTSGKLVPPTIPKGIEICSLCGHPIIHETWGGEQGSVAFPEVEHGNESGKDQPLCYGCTRTTFKK